MTKRPLAAFFSLLLVLSLALLAFAQTTAPSGRSPEAIADDLEKTMKQFHDAVQGGQALQAPEARKAVAPRAVPLLHQALTLVDELVAAQPAAREDLEPAVFQYRVMLLLLGDPEMSASVASEAAASDPAAARYKAVVAIANFLKATDDAGRNKALDTFDIALKSAPEDPVVLNLFTMTSMSSQPSTAIYQHMLTILKADVQSQDAQQLAQEMQDNLTQQALLNKPLVVQGVGFTAPKFSTDQWKGKVVLVDFWATWCGPCMAELPRVKEIYAKYHSQELEIVGVSCDNTGDDLKKFLAQNPDMPWPQLFDVKNPGWNPIADSLGVHGIPAMFLIDRKGILRSVNGRQDMESLIPRLLAEKP